MNLYRLIINDSDEYYTTYEYLGSKTDIWHLWFAITNRLNKSADVYDMNGVKQNPELGIRGLT